ncbi:MAG: hypothetical protein ACFFBD_18995, partial [Candidatus Hodarchaeota archaeon]
LSLFYFELRSIIPVGICLLLGQFSVARIVFEGYFKKPSEMETKKIYAPIYLLLLYSMSAIWSFLFFLSAGFSPQGTIPIVANIGAFIALILASPVELRYVLKQRAKLRDRNKTK